MLWRPHILGWTRPECPIQSGGTISWWNFLIRKPTPAECANKVLRRTSRNSWRPGNSAGLCVVFCNQSAYRNYISWVYILSWMITLFDIKNNYILGWWFSKYGSPRPCQLITLLRKKRTLRMLHCSLGRDSSPDQSLGRCQEKFENICSRSSFLS